MMRTLPPALAPLAAFRQFITYKVVPGRVAGKTDKLPLSPDGRVMNPHDPSIWTDAQSACDRAARLGPNHGVGFVLTEADPFWFLDIDACVQGGNWSPLAIQMLQTLSGAAVEVSQSGTGLHIIGTGVSPPHGCKNIPLKLEFYTQERFIALTGRNTGGSAAADLTARLPALVAEYFPPDEEVNDADWTDGPAEGWSGPADDDALINWAMRTRSARSVFGNSASFGDLWTADADVLSRAYPDSTGAGRAYDASSADAALAQHLAFWTGRDCERMQRLMQRSALVRDKWDREDYLRRTILGACSRQKDVLVERSASTSAPTPAPAEVPKPVLKENADAFLNVREAADLFAGCVYIVSQHRVLCPGGVLLKPEQFKVVYGGYVFHMDNANERSSRDAWEAFTQNQGFRPPTADGTCFRPAAAPGAVISEGGRSLANVWWPVDTPRKQGDIGPFADHLRRVLPDERDRTILLSYMAACVQHKGVKFQWAPLLQGTPGNGKTLFTRCVAEAIGRRYVHMPKASKLGNQFNAYMRYRLFIGVEDVYTPKHKAELFEELKDLITGDYQEVEGKGVDQETNDICANFMLNSNHRDAIRKSQDDRRIAPFFCAQQRKKDLARDGMTGDYFPRLYDWLRAEGYAIVTDLLYTYPIPDEYNPARGAHTAPQTTSTAAMIRESRGTIEQEVFEAIEQNLVGFAGGWVSSIYLDRLLQRLGAANRISHTKRREMLQDMGYEPHPSLPNGRVRGSLMPDGGTPVLFYYVGSGLDEITEPGEIAAAYTTAQMRVAGAAA